MIDLQRIFEEPNTSSMYTKERSIYFNKCRFSIKERRLCDYGPHKNFRLATKRYSTFSRKIVYLKERLARFVVISTIISLCKVSMLLRTYFFYLFRSFFRSKYNGHIFVITSVIFLVHLNIAQI